jgi:ABC-2 type transport system ATP-binding protein
MDAPVIQLTDLTKKYGAFTAVNQLNLTIQKGEIFGLLGPNGAGKSTTILMMLGLTDPTSGEVRVCDINSTTHPLEVKRKVGYLPDDVGFYDDRTGVENLIYTAELNGFSRVLAREKAEELLIKVGLEVDTKKKTGKYSRGMRQRLGLADVLIKQPEVIILDEPTSGLDPAGVHEFMNLIVQLSREQGLTVLFSSHHLHQVQQVCDRVGIFVGGHLLAEGDIPSLSQKLFAGEPFVIEAHVDSDQEVDLTSCLQNINGVLNVAKQNRLYRMGCSKDVTPDIARAIVQSGVGLTGLYKKEYGLDDIYNRYFEGGKKNG